DGKEELDLEGIYKDIVESHLKYISEAHATVGRQPGLKKLISPKKYIGILSIITLGLIFMIGVNDNNSGVKNPKTNTDGVKIEWHDYGPDFFPNPDYSTDPNFDPETPALPAERILVNGKVLTVDENFSEAQAILIKGDRIASVGTTKEILGQASPGAQEIDLDGRTVIPGILDNHTHYFRGSPYWKYEVFFDAVKTRAQAVQMLKDKIAATPPGEWVLSIGGWNIVQFTDSNEDFSKAELDRLAPNNPVFIQYWFEGGYGNSLAIEAVGPNTEGVNAETGRIDPTASHIHAGMPESVRMALPEYTAESWKKDYLRKMNTDYNRAGITTVWNAGALHYENKFPVWAYEWVKDNGNWSSVRIFHHFRSDVYAPELAEELITWIKKWGPIEQGDYFRLQTLGEKIYEGTYDLLQYFNPSPEDWIVYQNILEAAAEKGWPVYDHMMVKEKYEKVLSIHEAIDKKYDIKPLRWAIHHCDGMTKSQIERASKLGEFLAMHVGHSTPRPVREGKGLGMGRPSLMDRPPFKTAQESGIRWGLGTDAKIVSPYPAFFILYVAVTGKNVAGQVLIPTQTVSREEALIAFTRSNAWMFFMEDDLGSIEPGKYADIVVLDRDYMTCPEDEIRDIESVLTLVGGRVGYEAGI
ncbi:MAG: amidohydrolase family protein, partial [Deltaproteobacteria bacterium]|nr:amidohydrolase family protein [Deltaproteobacteria bacterium]